MDMSATIEDVIACQSRLLAALDARAVDAIENETAALARLLAGRKPKRRAFALTSYLTGLVKELTAWLNCVGNRRINQRELTQNQGLLAAELKLARPLL
jgi:hypothetical protein